MLDFTSALYLGFRHGSASLGPWDEFTLGRPAALQEPPGALEAGRELAQVQGCEASVLLPSTLHLFWDLFELLSHERIAIHMDAATYPIAQWALQPAVGRGVPLQTFRAHDPDDLRVRLRQASGRRRPVIVADGYSPGLGRVAPLADYVSLAREHGGLVVIDDTQALGLLGHHPSSATPYGHGGGGSLGWCGVPGGEPDILVGASLAKGFGAPLAALSGAAAWVRRYGEGSRTRVHCSPPSVAVIRAALHALHINRRNGDGLRAHLAALVMRFRQGLQDLGLSATGGLFPVQTLQAVPGGDACRLHQTLSGAGLRAVLHRGDDRRRAAISLLFTCRHRFQDIDQALAVLAQLAGPRRLMVPGGRSAGTAASQGGSR
jgi:8-amino-7-oxononanoate synthase